MIPLFDSSSVSPPSRSPDPCLRQPLRPDPGEDVVDELIRTGEGERFLKRAIEEQGRGTVVAVVEEIKERHGVARELERSLLELQQVFMDMAVLVTAQGEQLDDIESQVGKARSFVEINIANWHRR